MSAPLSARRTRLERVETFVRRTWLVRRVLFYGSQVFPAFVTLLLMFLALYPMLFHPTEKLTTMLTALVAGGLSFASVAFSASKSRLGDEVWSLRMAMAGSALFRFAIALAVVLALNAVRERAVANLGAGTMLDLGLRGVMVLVTGTAIAIAFFGFQTMVMLFGPALDERTTERLRRVSEAMDKAEEAP